MDVVVVLVEGMETVQVDALVAVSKGMWAVKLCSNKILLFLTEGAV